MKKQPSPPAGPASQRARPKPKLKRIESGKIASGRNSPALERRSRPGSRLKNSESQPNSPTKSEEILRSQSMDVPTLQEMTDSPRAQPVKSASGQFEMSSERRSSVQVAKILRQNTAPPSIDVADTRRYSIQVAQGLRDNNSVNFAGNAPVIDPAAGPARRLERAQTMSPKGMGAGLGTALGGAAAAPAAPHHLSAVPEDDLSRTLKRAASFRDDLMPEQRLENLMVEVKQSGLPAAVIFGALAPADKTHLPLHQWVGALRDLNRQAFFPLTEPECAEVAKLLFHVPAEGFEGDIYVHCETFREWCYDIKHLSWRAEKRRSRSDSLLQAAAGAAGATPSARSRQTSEMNMGEHHRSSINAPPLGIMFYSGNQFFWRTRQTIEFEMYLNKEDKAITILSCCRDTHKIYPALRVHSDRIVITKEAIENRCKEKFGVGILPSLQAPAADGASPRVNRTDPAYLKAIAEQGRRDAEARAELWAEYLKDRLTLPTPAEAKAQDGKDGPFLRPKLGDTWLEGLKGKGEDALLMCSPRPHPEGAGAVDRLRSRTSSFELFRKSSEKFKLDAMEASRQSTSARRSQQQLEAVMNALGSLANAEDAGLAGLSPAARRWRVAYRRVRCGLVCEGFRARLRRTPAYQKYMEKIDSLMPQATAP
uniref:Uncharacterized protein n=1 Tax=Heterosigma akashiwo TaxID=2829 RepID=A0A7S3UXL8_HETAK